MHKIHTMYILVSVVGFFGSFGFGFVVLWVFFNVNYTGYQNIHQNEKNDTAHRKYNSTSRMSVCSVQLPLTLWSALSANE